jgi:virginiamycin B lyase
MGSTLKNIVWWIGLKKWQLLLTISVIFGLLILTIFVPPIINNPTNERINESQINNPTYAPYITEYILPAPDSAPMAITVDQSGDVWVAATNTTTLVRFSPASNKFTEFKIPISVKVLSVWGMVVDSRGMIWFTSADDNSLWRFSPINGSFKQYPIPTPRSFPMRIAIDNQGQVWFTELFGGKLGHINPRSGEIVEYKVPRDKSGPTGVSIDSEGDIWFADVFAGKIAKFNPKDHTYTEYPPTGLIFSPTGLAVDSRGHVWFLEHGGSLFGKFTPSDNSTVKYATSITGTYPTTLPYWLAIDKVGNIWFNEHSGNRIARFDPKSETLVEYELPKGKIGTGGIVNALHFAIAPDGNVWFTEWTENKIAMINTSMPIKFKLNVSQRSISTTPGSAINIEVSLLGRSDRPIGLQTSGTFSFTGKLLNATAEFRPQHISNLKNASFISDLTVKLEQSLVPREYVMTVGASDGAIVYSVMVHLEVRVEG